MTDTESPPFAVSRQMQCSLALDSNERGTVQRPLALSLHTDENDPSGLDSGRDDASPVSRASGCRPAPPPGTSDRGGRHGADRARPSCTRSRPVVLLDDEHLLLLQVVEQADVVGRDEELGTPGIALPGTGTSGGSRRRCPRADRRRSRRARPNLSCGAQSPELWQQVEQTLRPAGFDVQKNRLVESTVFERDVLSPRTAIGDLHVPDSQVTTLNLRPDPISQIRLSSRKC